MTRRFSAIFLGCFTVLVLMFVIHIGQKTKNYSLITTSVSKTIDGVKTRDFMRLECENMKRIGGPSAYIKNAPHSLYRIDGSWFICLDGDLKPRTDTCNVLSFGINKDYSFDEEMNRDYECNVFSFDPLVEAEFFASIRAANKDLAQSSVIKVNPKWTFYRIGVSGGSSDRGDLSNVKIGEIIGLKSILRLTGLENRIIDVFKMDIEGPEKFLFADLDMDYACKYIKQLMFESHMNFRFRDLEKLEQCFLLFRRDTRFFEYFVRNPEIGVLTEFQVPGGYYLNITRFHNETYLAEFMFVTGELYFANRNFL